MPTRTNQAIAEEPAPTSRYRIADQQDRSRVITRQVSHPDSDGPMVVPPESPQSLARLVKPQIPMAPNTTIDSSRHSTSIGNGIDGSREVDRCARIPSLR